MTEELKPLPCPFCNSKPEVRHESMGTDYSVVVCPECLARGPESEPEQAAIKAWNTRSPAWRDDMENAPRDGGYILGLPALFRVPLVVSWSQEQAFWCVPMTNMATPYEPTHWMPLPLPPEET